MTIEERMQLQSNEFDAVAKLSEEYRRITFTPVVDDDYPEVRSDYEMALSQLIVALRANGRLK